MELYYISHPYTSNGDTRDNIKQSREIKKKLQMGYPDICFVNPLDEFGEYFGFDYHRVLAYCLKLLSKCDGIVMCGEWNKSKGCQAELAYATFKGLDITYLNEYRITQEEV